MSVKASLLAEELPAVPAVVTSLGQREADGAAGAAVHHLVLHPVVGRRAARLLTHGPAEDAAATVAHQDLTVVPEPGGGSRGEESKGREKDVRPEELEYFVRRYC